MNKLSLLIIACFLFIANYSVNAQNVAVTDDENYTADPSAMLDVKSLDKGVLVPRLTTMQRIAVQSPATGLLVYDTDFNNFFYHNGLAWVSLPQMNISGTEGPLFHVVNLNGDTIFAVYNDGVKITVPYGVKGKVGGFAVSGRTSTKAGEEPYLQVTPDSTRVFVNQSSLKGKVGGFAVSGRTSTKLGELNDILVATADSTRIYVNEEAQKGKVGGFAVSGRTSTKSENSFLNLSSNNYFIGHNSGLNTEDGQYNFFAGYNSGAENISGSSNIFIGYASGLSNIGDGVEAGNNNIFIGNRAGMNNDMGFNNIFLGYQSGYNNLGGEMEQGSFNTFIGYESGFTNMIGGSNTLMGYQAGYSMQDGNHNTYIGRWAGANNANGSYNVFIGTEAGRYETRSWKLNINASNTISYVKPLIFGDFHMDNRLIVIDGNDSLLYNYSGPEKYKFYVNGQAGGFSSWVVYDQGKTNTKQSSEINNSLDKILQLKGVSFIQNKKGGEIIRELAIDAASASKVIPEIVKGEMGFYGIKYSKLSVLLIEAVKEQQQLINEMQNKIDQLSQQLLIDEKNTEIENLKSENEKLKKDIELIKQYLEMNE